MSLSILSGLFNKSVKPPVASCDLSPRIATRSTNTPIPKRESPAITAMNTCQRFTEMSTSRTEVEDPEKVSHQICRNFGPQRWAFSTATLFFVVCFLSLSSSAVVSVPLPSLTPNFGRGGIDFGPVLRSNSIAREPMSSSTRIQLDTGEYTKDPEEYNKYQEEGVAVSGDDKPTSVGGTTGSDSAVESPRNQINYVIQPQGRIYLPSVINEGDGGPRSTGLTGVGGDDLIDGGVEQTSDPQDYRFSSSKILQKDGDDSNESGRGWETVIDPHLYLLTEWNSNAAAQQQRMRRNTGPSLSIVNPLDVLRQRLLLEIARRKMRQSHNQIMANAEILKNIGRRRRR